MGFAGIIGVRTYLIEVCNEFVCRSFGVIRRPEWFTVEL